MPVGSSEDCMICELGGWLKNSKSDFKLCVEVGVFLEREDGYVLRVDAASVFTSRGEELEIITEPQLGRNPRDKVQPLFSVALTRYQILVTLAIISQFFKGLYIFVLLSVATFNSFWCWTKFLKSCHGYLVVASQPSDLPLTICS
jgi:hypothetical protein